jgi:RNA polymerase sigma-70 factor (ECF subfamily)
MITRKLKHLTPEEESILVAEAQLGSKAALNRLIETHYQQMYHLALKVTRNQVLAEDVTQEACVQVLRRIEQFRSESRFNSWLSRIVVNTALLRHRRDKRLVPTDEIFSTDEVSPEPEPEQIIINKELLEKTDRFLSQLREGDRDLFVKRFVEGLSLQSISEETGLSLPALKSRFHRARNRLKETSINQGWGVDLQDYDGATA